MSTAAGVAGWYPDPWDPWMMRWWDGAAWTAHVAAGAPPPADQYDAEKGTRTATWAGWAFLGRGVAASAQFLLIPLVFGRFWDEVWDMTETESGPPFSGFQAGGFIVISQLAGLASWAALVFLCIWSFRALRNARGLGLTTTFEPAWGVAGWLIPIANLVMPWMTVRDALPEGHPGRRAAGRWWATEIAAVVIGAAAMFLALAGTGIGVAAGAVASALAIAAGVQGRRLTRTIRSVHHEIARSAGMG